MSAAVAAPIVAAPVAAAIAAIAVGSDVITVPPAAVTDAIGFVIICAVTVPVAISAAIADPIHGAARRGQHKKAESDNDR
jgi:hypothetical protein